MPLVKPDDGSVVTMTPASRLEVMSQTVRGVISRRKGEPVELVDIVVPDPGPGEAVVDVIACGVCHTDLTYREGGITDGYPFLLGHEAAGTVEAVGPDVTAVRPGDFVILNWRAVCGQCRACKRGRSQYCFDTFNAEQKMTLADHTELTPALGIGAFADKTLVHAGQCTKVDAAADPAAAGLLGCGVMAGLGAAINTGAVTRDDTDRRGCPGRRQTDNRGRHGQHQTGLGPPVRCHPHH
jgi:S-(hydroxymethyl)mycothiol dehydrogenase